MSGTLLSVDYYSNTGSIFIGGESSSMNMRVESRLGKPTTMYLNEWKVDSPWVLRIHCRDGSVQTIANGDQFLRDRVLHQAPESLEV